MKQGTNDIAKLEGLVKQYRLAHPVPADFQEAILSRKGDVFRRILKSTGQHGFIYGIFLTLYFFLKKAVPGLPIIKTLLSLLLVLSVSLGGYYAARYLMREIDPVLMDYPTNISSDMKNKDTSASVIATTIGIIPFASSSLDRKTAEEITDLIARELIRLRGESFSRPLIGQKKIPTKFILIGSAEYVGGSVFLVAKIIDRENASIVYITEEKIPSTEKIDKACRLISERISARIK